MNVQLYDRTVYVGSAEPTVASYAGYVGEALTNASQVPCRATFRILTDEQIQEYRETASPLAKEPWDEFHLDMSEWGQR